MTASSIKKAAEAEEPHTAFYDNQKESLNYIV